MRVTSAEFQQNAGRYQDAALQAAVAMTNSGRPDAVLMSGAFFKMLMKGRVVRRVEELDDDTLKAISGGTVAPEYAGLDSLVKDWTP